VRKLGSEIDGRLGFHGMQAAAHAIEEVDPDLTSHLSQFWHGGGDWLA